MIIKKVKRIKPDNYARPRLQDIETKAIYADISLGDAETRPEHYERVSGGYTQLNIPGDWFTTLEDGEPFAPLRLDVYLELVTDTKELNR